MCAVYAVENWASKTIHFQSIVAVIAGVALGYLRLTLEMPNRQSE